MSYQCIHQPRQMSKILNGVKEVRHKRVHVVWFHSYEVQEQAKPSLEDMTKIELPLMGHWKGHRECDSGVFYLDWACWLHRYTPLSKLTNCMLNICVLCHYSSIRDSEQEKEKRGQPAQAVVQRTWMSGEKQWRPRWLPAISQLLAKTQLKKWGN